MFWAGAAMRTGSKQASDAARLEIRRRFGNMPTARIGLPLRNDVAACWMRGGYWLTEGEAQHVMHWLETGSAMIKGTRKGYEP